MGIILPTTANCGDLFRSKENDYAARSGNLPDAGVIRFGPKEFLEVPLLEYAGSECTFSNENELADVAVGKLKG